MNRLTDRAQHDPSGLTAWTVKPKHKQTNILFISVLEAQNRQQSDEEIIDKYCFYVRYEIPEKSGGGDWSNDYLARIRKSPHIRRG